MEILRDWERLRTWIGSNAPVLLDSLNPGASEDQIFQAEKRMSASLPEEMVALYRVHNGQKERDAVLLGAVTWLSLENMVDEWKVWKDLLDGGDFKGITSEPERGIRNDWWNPLWIPFTYDGAGNHLCIDLAPGPGGRLGQVITMWHDEASRSVVAPSFGAWLKTYADGVERGKHVYSEDYGGIVDRDDA